MVKTYFAACEAAIPERRGELRRIALALRRARIDTMEALCALQRAGPEKLLAIRSIGKKSLPLIAAVCARYEENRTLSARGYPLAGDRYLSPAGMPACPNTRRKFMKRRILGIFCALALCLTLLPATALARDVSALRVGGISVLSGGYWKTDPETGGLTDTGADENDYNVKYDKDSSTLTLNNATISAEDSNYRGIFANGDLNIVLEGENTVQGGSYKYGVYIPGNLIVSGTGSLTAEGSICGIYVIYNSMTVKSGSVEGTVTGTNDLFPSGIYVSESMTVEGGSVKGTATGQGGTYGIKVNGNISVTGGTVEGTSQGNYGIYVGESMTVESGSVTGAANVNSGGEAAGIRVVGTLDMTGGEITGRGHTTILSMFDTTSEEKMEDVIRLPDGYLPTGYKLASALGESGNAYITFVKTDDELDYNGETGEITGAATEITLAHYYTVTVEGGTGSGQHVAGKPVTVTAETPTGYTFTGWTAEGVTLDDPASASVTFPMPENNVTLTAHWKLGSYTVTFATNGGSAVDSQTVNYGAKVAAPSAPTRAGYTFQGWYQDAACTDAWDMESDTVAGDITLYAKWTAVSTGGSSTGGGSSSGSSGNKTETTRNPDGSITTTVTKPDGTVTETTKWPDGSQQVIETKKDGTVTTTTTDTAGNKTEVVENPDGSTETTITNTDGSSSTTTVSESGQVEAEVKLPADVVNDAQEKGQAVRLPMPEVPVTADRENAPTVTVDLPGNTAAKVEIPVKNVTPGTVAVIVKADGSEEVIKTSVTTENGVAVTLHDGDTVKIVDNSKTFYDVSDNYWGAGAIDFATSRELFSGTSATTFSPNTAMTRAMLVTVLARLEGVDATVGATWYEAGVAWAVQNGISDGSNMEQNLTREQMATMLYRYAQSKGYDVTNMRDLSRYSDAGNVSAWAVEALQWATAQGLVTSMGDGTLSPQGSATRAQVAIILQRFIEGMA